MKGITRTRYDDKGENNANKVKRTSKDRVKKHREKLKLDPTKYEEAKIKDREWKKIEREEKRNQLLSNKRELDSHRENNKMRMRTYRANQKQKEQDELALSRKSAAKETNRKEQKKSYKLRVQLDKKKSAKNVRVQNWRLRKQINEDIANP